MSYIVLFFLLQQLFLLIYNKKIYFLLQRLTNILMDNATENSNPKIILFNSSSLFFPIYMATDFLYLLFCFWLLFTNDYWQPGGMLFLITALESYAFHVKIDSIFYLNEEDGFIYPRIWARCFFSGLSLFILTRLYYAI